MQQTLPISAGGCASTPQRCCLSDGVDGPAGPCSAAVPATHRETSGCIERMPSAVIVQGPCSASVYDRRALATSLVRSNRTAPVRVNREVNWERERETEAALPPQPPSLFERSPASRNGGRGQLNIAASLPAYSDVCTRRATPTAGDDQDTGGVGPVTRQGAERTTSLARLDRADFNSGHDQARQCCSPELPRPGPDGSRPSPRARLDQESMSCSRRVAGARAAVRSDRTAGRTIKKASASNFREPAKILDVHEQPSTAFRHFCDGVPRRHIAKSATGTLDVLAKRQTQVSTQLATGVHQPDLSPRRALSNRLSRAVLIGLPITALAVCLAVPPMGTRSSDAPLVVRRLPR